MLKTEAIELLGGSPAAAAREVGVSTQAISQWPDQLPPRIIDRVQAALWRISKRGAAHAPGEPEQSAADLAIADRRRSERRAIDDQAAGQGA